MLLLVCLSSVIYIVVKYCVFVCVCCEIFDQLKLNLFKKLFIFGPAKDLVLHGLQPQCNAVGRYGYQSG